MLADISNVDAIYIGCGRTDMRKFIDGLCTIIQEQFSILLYVQDWQIDMYRQRIIECALKLKDERLLRCAYAYMKRLSEGEV